MLDVTNRQGPSYRYGGVTMARTRRGQIYLAQDHLFDSDIIRHLTGHAGMGRKRDAEQERAPSSG